MLNNDCYQISNNGCSTTVETDDIWYRCGQRCSLITSMVMVNDLWVAAWETSPGCETVPAMAGSSLVRSHGPAHPKWFTPWVLHWAMPKKETRGCQGSLTTLMAILRKHAKTQSIVNLKWTRTGPSNLGQTLDLVMAWYPAPVISRQPLNFKAHLGQHSGCVRSPARAWKTRPSPARTIRWRGNGWVRGSQRQQQCLVMVNTSSDEWW